jgi:cbb3-type cytochrome oxidase subunit 3
MFKVLFLQRYFGLGNFFGTITLFIILLGYLYNIVL